MAIELRKGQKVSLRKENAAFGEIVFNLNWDQPEKKGWFFGQRQIDLDLGCLYELKNGRKGTVRALGNAFGSLGSEPYILLDGDDRSGANASGETIRVNMAKLTEIKRILVFTFIYSGVAKWEQTNGRVNIRCTGNEELLVRMDEYGSNQRMCAIVLLEDDGNDHFQLEKIVRFFNGHQEMDRAFGWGMRWVAGSK